MNVPPCCIWYAKDPSALLKSLAESTAGAGQHARGRAQPRASGRAGPGLEQYRRQLAEASAGSPADPVK